MKELQMMTEQADPPCSSTIYIYIYIYRYNMILNDCSFTQCIKKLISTKMLDLHSCRSVWRVCVCVCVCARACVHMHVFVRVYMLVCYSVMSERSCMYA